jgi:hypothetical protein
MVSQESVLDTKQKHTHFTLLPTISVTSNKTAMDDYLYSIGEVVEKNKEYYITIEWLTLSRHFKFTFN